jgi:fatty-acyl-CoA synthase
LLRDAERVARALLARFRPGEHIAVYAPNVAQWLLLELGAGLAGLVLVTVNPANRARELEYVLRQSRSAGLFHVHGFRGNPMGEWVAQVRGQLPALREVVALEQWDEFLATADERTALPHVTPDDPAQIQYTSGTTGSPKGALLQHRALTNNSRIYAQLVETREGCTYAHAMPFFHTAGCVMATLGTIQARATHAFLPAFEPGRLLELLEHERATHVMGVPTMMIAMLEHPDFPRRDLSHLRVAVAGGASVPPEIVRSIESRLGVRFCIVYGQTEASPLITQTRLDDSPEDKAHTVGPPLPQADVKIVDPATGETVPFGAVGELCARGYMIMREYFDRPDATAAALDAGGWLHTGDLATMDARGYCRITGRLKDMVIRGGENLFPAEVEAALIEHPSVAEVAVIGVPDPRMGEELCAFVRGAGGQRDVGVLRAYVRERLAAPKTPRYWVFVENFPLTGSGKIQKFVLRDLWTKGECAVVDAAAGRSQA